MISPFTLSEPLYLLIILIIGFTTLIQTFTLVLTYYQKNILRSSYLEEVYELLLLLAILMFAIALNKSLVLINLMNNVTSLFDVFILLLALSLLIITIIIYRKNKQICFWGLFSSFVLLFSFIQLSFFLLIVTILMLLSRSIFKSFKLFKLIKKDISAVSVVSAINTIKTGILVFKNDGQIVLINYQMQELMILFANKIYRNANDFEKQLNDKKTELLFKKENLESQTVFILSDNRVWMFSKKEIILKKTKYYHLVATDVSAIWKLKEILDRQNEQLEKKSRQLKKTIANLYSSSQEKEIELISAKAHDVLGQHLSLMLRTINKSDDVDLEMIKSIASNLLSDIVEEDLEESSLNKLLSLKNVFKAINVDIKFEGVIPIDKKTANLLIDLIRESTTNAVRHGFASEIEVNLDTKDKYYKLSISNNGYSPKDKITYGSGIKEMKRKVVEMGGNFDIVQKPIFKLIAIIPGGEKI